MHASCHRLYSPSFCIADPPIALVHYSNTIVSVKIFLFVLSQEVQNSIDAATSTSPPAASNVRIANSLVAPKSINVRMCCSGCLLVAGCEAATGLLASATGGGAAPSVCPPPGKDDDEGPGFDADDELEASKASCSAVSSGSRALSGSSCSDRNPTSRPWIRRTFLARSIHA